MTKSPSTYSEWAALLDKLKAETDGGDDILEQMNGGQIAISQGYTERIISRFADLINVRIKFAIDRFQKDMSTTCGHESYIAQAFTAFRKRIAFVYRIAAITPLPESAKKTFQAELKVAVDNINKSIADSAQKIGDSRIRLLISGYCIKPEAMSDRTNSNLPPPIPNSNSHSPRRVLY